MLVWDSTYQDFMNAQPSRPASPPMVALPDVVLLLPEPYASCSRGHWPECTANDECRISIATCSS